MQVASANGASRDLQYDIAVFKGLGFGSVNYKEQGLLSIRTAKLHGQTLLTYFDRVLAHPHQRLHCFARRIAKLLGVPRRVGSILLRDGVIAMTQDFLEQVGSLRQGHI